jgi:hypothetical protein
VFARRWRVRAHVLVSPASVSAGSGLPAHRQPCSSWMSRSTRTLSLFLSVVGQFPAPQVVADPGDQSGRVAEIVVHDQAPCAGVELDVPDQRLRLGAGGSWRSGTIGSCCCCPVPPIVRLPVTSSLTTGRYGSGRRMVSRRSAGAQPAGRLCRGPVSLGGDGRPGGTKQADHRLLSNLPSFVMPRVEQRHQARRSPDRSPLARRVHPGCRVGACRWGGLPPTSRVPAPW